jgi:hypothetical protein
MPILKRLLLVLATVLAAFAVTSPAIASAGPGQPGQTASTASVKPQYRIFDLFYQAYDPRPKTYYFTANSGPVMENMRWNSWGTRRAFAKGRYVLDCGTCGPTREVYRARVELAGRVRCTGYYKRFRSYKWMKVTVFYPESEGGTRSRAFEMGCPPADYDPR